MKDDDLIVGRKPQVAFDSATEFESRGKSGQAVFGTSEAAVQAPVREAERTRIERVRP